MRNAIDITLIAVYLIGTVIFGCSFFWKKKRRGSGADAQQRVPPGETEVDAEKEFVTGGGRLPTWAVSLSVFATLVSSISFLCFPAGAYGAEQWKGWVNSIALPFATVIAMIWFVPFYRKSTSASAYSFLEERYGLWARIYASVCFLILQNARPGIILLLLAYLLEPLLGFSYESTIIVTGVVTMLYAMTGGFAAVVWADAIQSILLIVGTVVAVVFLVVLTPDFGTHLAAAWDAGKFSLGSFSLTNWADSTFWVLFLCNICLNLQNFGIDQCYTQRYAAAKDLKAARSSIWTSSWMYSGITLLFTLIGTLLWMFNRANPGVIPAGTTADQVFPWFIVNKLPPGVSGLLMAAIIAAAMSTIAATLNSGATVLLEDYWKRFAPQRANPRSNVRFLRAMTVALAVVSVGIALAVVRFKPANDSILKTWWVMQSLLSGGMLGLFIIGVFARKSRSWHAAIAVACGTTALCWTTFFGGRFVSKIMALVFATITIVVLGFVLSSVNKRNPNCVRECK